MAAKKLRKKSVFRVCYRVEKPADCVGQWSGCGRHLKVVADTVEEAIERVKSHEGGCGPITLGEVVRETMEVWV